MTDELERAWWSSCRARLEAKFAQDEVLSARPLSKVIGRLAATARL